MKKERKLGKLITEGQSEKIVRIGMFVELFPFIVMSIAFVLGAVLCFCDIKDDGMFLQIIWKGLSIQYLGTYIGVAVIVLSIIFFIVRKPDMTIKK